MIMGESESRKGFYFNQEACIGCRTCQIACKDKNDLDVGMLFRHVLSFEVGNYPNTGVYHLSISCNHCLDPACVKVCPTGAMYIDAEDGTVQHNDDVCIGCRSCVMACPYGHPKYNEATRTVHKCDACIQLRAEGEQPSCVASCVMRALEFGDIEELRSAHPQAVDSIAVLVDSSKTHPSLLIDPRDCAGSDEYRQLMM